MVQFYQSRDVGANLAKGLREGLREGLGPTLDYKINQSRVASALDLAQNEIKDAESPADALITLSKHLLPLKDGAQVLSKVAPTLLQTWQSKAAPGIIEEANKPVSEAEEKEPPRKAGVGVQRKEAEIQQQPVNQQTAPQQPTFSQLQSGLQQPQFPSEGGQLTPPKREAGQLLSPVSPQERSSLLQKYGQQYGSEFVNNLIQQEDTWRDSQNAFIQNQINTDKAIQEQQKAFTENLQNQIDKSFPDEPNEMRNLQYKLALRHSNLPDVPQMVDAMRPEWQELKGAISKIRNHPRPNFSRLTGSDAKKNIETLQNAFEPFRKYNMENEGRAFLSDSSWGPVQTDLIVNPPSEQFKNDIKSIPKNNIKYSDFDNSYDIFQTPAQISEKAGEAEKQYILPKLNEILSKNTDQSLHVIRKAFMDQGYSWQGFRDAINDLIKSKEVELNGYNQSIYSDMAQPPIDALDGLFYGKIWNLFNFIGGKQ